MAFPSKAHGLKNNFLPGQTGRRCKQTRRASLCKTVLCAVHPDNEKCGFTHVVPLSAKIGCHDNRFAIT